MEVIFKVKATRRREGSGNTEENINNLLELAIKWNCFEGVKDILEEKQYDYKLTKNRQYLFGESPEYYSQLDDIYSRWIGAYVFPICDKNPSVGERLKLLFVLVLNKLRISVCASCTDTKSSNETSASVSGAINANPTVSLLIYKSVCKYYQQHMLRDLFLWSVLTNRTEMSKVFLLHIESRISAALVATAILKNLSHKTLKVDEKHEYKRQSIDFELYATKCIDECYKHSEEKACELIIREVPLFGDVTCMQFAYVWFLLVFSYMMLYDFDSTYDPNSIPYWQPIYVTLTVSSMLCEELLRIGYYQYTRSVEYRSDNWVSGLLRKCFYALPYVLFYVGIFLKYEYGNRPNCLTAARIILAFDLELWFLLSLRFLSAIKILGPKLFMIQNMLRDLLGFLWVMFVFVAAYGVVSRAMIKYNQVEFNLLSILGEMFYPAYWFLYSIVDDDKNELDNIIGSANSSANAIAEATATHVLLAFHMLIINILVLNLAVFASTINRVQNNIEYFWRYQRYLFIQEYFECAVPYPPLNLILYLYLFCHYLLTTPLCLKNNKVANIKLKKAEKEKKFKLRRIFKISTTPEKEVNWTKFENAATYTYARSVVNKKKNMKRTKI
ncbi:unnamed protein product [Didymodactylos carnosus]|uniref:TRPM-like domain-containing protein n=1 Tax=Didymodactylos carnosus TaxID=1234261 RepID=A0A814B0R9_9BILA|nr:unnamed protein product [Didymodactylos carnosus]CAF0921169.1 unnamed protein product [Didymodactylos carnosus]CAF3660927.1 unnamed protein product [Didymodactylos carnosus]CAF3700465.1 unnamed protein product [Didymodactylos carnosus]